MDLDQVTVQGVPIYISPEGINGYYLIEDYSPIDTIAYDEKAMDKENQRPTIENSLKPMRDALLASKKIVKTILDRLEAKMTQLEHCSNISEMVNLKAELNKTKVALWELQDRELQVKDTGMEQLAANFGVSIVSLLVSPLRYPILHVIKEKCQGDAEETDKDALEEENDPDIPQRRQLILNRPRSSHC
ncbi:hypothetical protein HAX54_031661 [Datura stramonium]|uniref:Uncharacterized protein n=1 Tax=Datura stramonium TaxID=4076 RepID=A0ABS8VAE5_DATST|nr:hypothetical protein [Datura stramonium]